MPILSRKQVGKNANVSFLLENANSEPEDYSSVPSYLGPQVGLYRYCTEEFKWLFGLSCFAPLRFLSLYLPVLKIPSPLQASFQTLCFSWSLITFQVDVPRQVYDTYSGTQNLIRVVSKYQVVPTVPYRYIRDPGDVTRNHPYRVTSLPPVWYTVPATSYLYRDRY
jgi:hypothetical protein